MLLRCLSISYMVANSFYDVLHNLNTKIWIPPYWPTEILGLLRVQYYSFWIKLLDTSVK